MSEINRKLIAEKIAENLINSSFAPTIRGEIGDVQSNKNIMVEQYKLLIDSSHKIETSRGVSNTLFIGINTIIASVMLHLTQISKPEIGYISLLTAVILVGILISWDWLRVIDSYKKINLLNHLLIESLESWLPTNVFSLRAKIEIEESDQKRKNIANIIPVSEKLLPKVFLATYILCLCITIIRIAKDIY